MITASRKERLLDNMAPVMTVDEFKRFKATIDGLTDEEFEMLAAEAAESSEYADMRDTTLKESYEMQLERAKAANITAKNSAANLRSAPVLDAEKNNMFLNLLREQKYSDVITVDRRADLELIRLWVPDFEVEKFMKVSNKAEGMHTVTKNRFVPSDLLFAGTVPLTDCKILVDERGYFGGEGKLNCCRISVFKDYVKRVKDADEDSHTVVGIAAMEYEGMDKPFLYGTFAVVKGIDSLVYCDMGYNKMRGEIAEQVIKDNFTLQKFGDSMAEWMSTWYGIQVALLHPLVRDVFREPRTVAVKSGSAKKHSKNGRRKVRYIKEHVLNASDIERSLYGMDSEQKGFVRKTLVWYVIGHWRTYKETGKKVFIQGTWKGPLRDIKRKIEERDREIAGI